LTFTSGIAVAPIWSPDGRTVVFSSGGPFNLYRKDSSGAGMEERLTRSPNRQVTADWSRDGRNLLYYEFSAGRGRNLWILEMGPDGRIAPGATPRPYLPPPASAYYGSFSPEESPRWVAFVSDESGRDEVYVGSFPEPRGKFQISTAGGQYPRWGQGDGRNKREIFYSSLDGQVMAVSVQLGTDSLTASAPVELFSLSGADLNSARIPFDVTPDGQRFLVREATERARQPLHLIVNWPALLKKRATP
jgi:Tol biopolymer transport system component